METRKMFFSRRNLLKGSAASLAATGSVHPPQLLHSSLLLPQSVL